MSKFMGYAIRGKIPGFFGVFSDPPIRRLKKTSPEPEHLFSDLFEAFEVVMTRIFPHDWEVVRVFETTTKTQKIVPLESGATFDYFGIASNGCLLNKGFIFILPSKENMTSLYLVTNSRVAQEMMKSLWGRGVSCELVGVKLYETKEYTYEVVS